MENKNNINKLETETLETQATIESDVMLLKPGQYVEAVGRQFDFEHANRYWEAQYGIVEPPSILVDRFGNRYDDRKYKGIFQNGKLLKEPSRDYVTFPNEEMINVVKRLVGDGSTKLRIWKEPEFSNHGLNCHVTVLSTEHGKVIEGSNEKNDFVRLGIVVRNSVGGGLALGTDLFTFRDVCQNGAIFEYEDIGHQSMRHYGKDSAKITRLMRELIESSVNRIEEIYNYYERMTRFKLRERQYVIPDLRHYIPEKYFPDYVDFYKEKIATEIGAEGKATQTKTVTKIDIDEKAKDMTLWEVFNSFTKNLWHSDLNMEHKRFTTMNLHKIIIDAVSKEN
jgi:hypothetical protein